jgi:hypothetical protein
VVQKRTTSVGTEKLQAVSPNPCSPFLVSLIISSSAMYSSTLKIEGAGCSETLQKTVFILTALKTVDLMKNKAAGPF